MDNIISILAQSKRIRQVNKIDRPAIENGKSISILVMRKMKTAPSNLKAS